MASSPKHSGPSKPAKGKILTSLRDLIKKPAPKAKSKPAASQPPAPAIRRPKIGLALGAGVARGWAHLGVVKRLAEEGIKVDVIAGTSIGAVVGGAMAAGKSAALEAWALELKEFSFFRSLDWRLAASGLFGSGQLEDIMIENFGDLNFQDLKIPFTAIACELKTGHEIWLKEGRLVDAIQASFALPGVFEPRKIDGRWLVDGALVNPTPVSVCRAMGAELVIAVNLAEDIYGRAKTRTQVTPASKTTKGSIGPANDSPVNSPVLDDYGVFSSGPEQLDEAFSTPKAGAKRGGFLTSLFRRKNDAPSIFANMIASLAILQNRLSRSRLAGDPPDVSIIPRTGHIGLMDFHRAKELMAEGEAAFDLALPHIKDTIAIMTARINQ